MTNIEFQIILWIQDCGAAIEPVMRLLTDLGYGPLYLIVIAVLCWCGSPALGTRLAVLLLLSSSLNSLLKILIHAPRPYWLRPELFVGSGDGAAGMPSGHAQAATVFWGALAVTVRRWKFWVLAIAMIAGTCVSRLYFAVHFPSQVLVGAAIGIGVLIAGRLLEQPVMHRFQRLTLTSQIGSLVMLYFLLVAIGIAVQFGVHTHWQPPGEWADAATQLHPTTELHTLSLMSFVRGGALLLGITIGACVLWQRGQFNSQRPSYFIGLCRVIPGLAVGLALWMGFGAVASGLPSPHELIVQGFRGLFFGLWLALVWPLIYLQFSSATGRKAGVTR